MRTSRLVLTLLVVAAAGCASRPTPPPAADTTTAIESTRTEVQGLDQDSQALAQAAQQAKPAVQVCQATTAALEHELTTVTAERDQAKQLAATADAAATAQRTELEQAKAALAQSQKDYDEAKRSLEKAVELLKQRDEETTRLKTRVLELEGKPAPAQAPDAQPTGAIDRTRLERLTLVRDIVIDALAIGCGVGCGATRYGAPVIIASARGIATAAGAASTLLP